MYTKSIISVLVFLSDPGRNLNKLKIDMAIFATGGMGLEKICIMLHTCKDGGISNISYKLESLWAVSNYPLANVCQSKVQIWGLHEDSKY